MTDRTPEQVNGALKYIDRLREGLRRDFERAMAELDAKERQILGLIPEPPTTTKG